MEVYCCASVGCLTCHCCVLYMCGTHVVAAFIAKRVQAGYYQECATEHPFA